MTRTATDIANMTADHLDLDPIGNINTDPTGFGKQARRNYAEAVGTVISEFSWNCATTHATVSEMDMPAGFDVDATDHQHMFPYPTDCLGIVEINGRPVDEVTHQVMMISDYDGNGTLTGRRKVILCDLEDSITLKIKIMIDAADMDFHLAKAVSIELAMRCVMKATNSTQKAAMLEKMYTTATRGDNGRVGGHQVSSRENKPLKPRAYPSTGGHARAGSGRDGII